MGVDPVSDTGFCTVSHFFYYCHIISGVTKAEIWDRDIRVAENTPCITGQPAAKSPMETGGLPLSVASISAVARQVLSALSRL